MNLLFQTLGTFLGLNPRLDDKMIGKWSDTMVSIITPDVAGPRKFVKMQSIKVLVVPDTLVGRFRVGNRFCDKKSSTKLRNKTINRIVKKVYVEVATNIDNFIFIF